MLSNETRLKRINERLLEAFNCYIDFEKECNVIYRPYLYLDIANGLKVSDGHEFKLRGNPLLCVSLGLEVKGSIVYLAVRGLDRKSFFHQEDFKIYLNFLKEVEAILSHCNSYRLRIPKVGEDKKYD